MIVDSITLPSAVDSSRSKDCIVSVVSLMAAAGGIRQIWKLQVFAYFYYGGFLLRSEILYEKVILDTNFNQLLS